VGTAVKSRVGGLFPIPCPSRPGPGPGGSVCGQLLGGQIYKLGRQRAVITSARERGLLGCALRAIA
jgi:hypothetical protein